MSITALIPDSLRRTIDAAASSIIDELPLIDEMFNLAVSGQRKYSPRAARVIARLMEIDNEIEALYINKIIHNLNMSHSESVLHSLLKPVASYSQPYKLNQISYLLNFCFDLMNRKMEQIASKVYAIDILYKISRTNPEIRRELTDAILMQIDYSTPAFITHGRRILSKLGIKDLG
jgi:hypothetical protein